MKQIKEIKHKFAIELVADILKCIPVEDSGTYNQQDPTHYEKGSIEVELKGIIWKLETYDCTWGITLTINRMIPKYTLEHYQQSTGHFDNPYPKFTIGNKTGEWAWKELQIGEVHLTQALEW